MALLRLALVSSLLLVAGCRNLQPAGSAPTERLEGTVHYLERILLPPGAVLRVSLNDPANTAASITTYLDGELGSPPFAFVLDYDPRRIPPGRVLRIEAEITLEGKVWFRGARSIADLYPDAPVELRVHRVGASD